MELKRQRALIGPGEGLVFREDVHDAADQFLRISPRRRRGGRPRGWRSSARNLPRRAQERFQGRG